MNQLAQLGRGRGPTNGPRFEFHANVNNNVIIFENELFLPMNRIRPSDIQRTGRGSVYQQYSGSFGNYKDPVIKRASKMRNTETGVTHKDLVLNDIRKMEELGSSGMVQRLLQAEESINTFLIAVERYEVDLETILFNCSVIGEDEAWGFYDPGVVMKDAFAALKYLHSRAIVHRDIKPKNIVIHVQNGECQFYKKMAACLNEEFFLGSYKGILRGLKYSQNMLDVESEDMKQAFARKNWACQLNLQNGYGVGHDKYSMACVLYCIYKDTLITSPHSTLEMDFYDGTMDFRKVMLRHLIRIIMRDVRQPDAYRLRIADFMEHPYFWSLSQLALFEDNLWIFSQKLQSVKDAVIRGSRSVLFDTETGWISMLEGEAYQKVAETIPQYQWKSVLGLWSARRNRRTHGFEDGIAVQEELGYVPEENFYNWEVKFPHFFMSIYGALSNARFIRKLRHSAREMFVTESPELRFFFPGRQVFYRAMNNLDI